MSRRLLLRHTPPQVKIIVRLSLLQETTPVSPPRPRLLRKKRLLSRKSLAARPRRGSRPLTKARSLRRSRLPQQFPVRRDLDSRPLQPFPAQKSRLVPKISPRKHKPSQLGLHSSPRQPTPNRRSLSRSPQKMIQTSPQKLIRTSPSPNPPQIRRLPRLTKPTYLNKDRNQRLLPKLNLGRDRQGTRTSL